MPRANKSGQKIKARSVAERRRVRYQVAVSLDGFIAGPNGEYDWIVMDPSIDFAALYKEFDTVVMGRKTYEVALAQARPARCRALMFSSSRGLFLRRTCPACEFSTKILAKSSQR